MQEEISVRLIFEDGTQAECFRGNFIYAKRSADLERDRPGLARIELRQGERVIEVFAPGK